VDDYETLYPSPATEKQRSALALVALFIGRQIAAKRLASPFILKKAGAFRAALGQCPFFAFLPLKALEVRLTL